MYDNTVAMVTAMANQIFVLCSLQDMATLRDFIAYSRTYIHPGLSEEAGQALVQAYVGMLYMHVYYNCHVIIMW